MTRSARRRAWRFPALGLALAASLSSAAGASSSECSSISGARLVPVLELYTSEGCHSCPAADRWVSRLPERGLAADRLVVLAFHVDYWDHLGWPDRYASRSHSVRQRMVAHRNKASFVYTPQLVLDGRDYRRGYRNDDIVQRVTELNGRTPEALLSLARRDTVKAGVAAVLRITLRSPAQAAAPEAWVALYEDGLKSRVTAGENRGRLLAHDNVVRGLHGPYPVNTARTSTIRLTLALENDWQRDRLTLAAFVSDRQSGRILQSVARGPCAPDGDAPADSLRR